MLATAVLIALAASPAPSFVPEATVPSHSAPPIEEVQRRAIEHARLDPSEITSWKKRARLAALFPKLQVSYDRRVKNDVNVDVNDSVYVGSSGTAVGPPQGGYAASSNSDNNIGLKAVWNFDEALFNPDVLAVSEEARLLARERQAILAEVNKNYYERDRAAGEIAFLGQALPRDPRPDKVRREIFLQRVALDEATAALDALTGGWFSKQTGREFPSPSPLP